MKAAICKTRFFCACIFISAFCVNSLWAEEKAAPPPDPYANAQVLVEAFVVEVNTAGLQEVGVNPISQGPDGITIAKLAACLQKDKSAKVISGVKVSVRQNEEGSSEEGRTIYYKRTNKSVTIVDNKPVTSVSVQFSPYDFNKHLGTRAIIQPDKSIVVEYDYGEHGVTPDLMHYDPNDGTLPNNYSYQWRGRLSLTSGKPAIVGATQNENRVVFLVLTATAQNMPEAKQEQAGTAAPSS